MTKCAVAPLLLLLLLIVLCACGEGGGSRALLPALPPDPHSYGNPQETRVSALDLDLDADFAARRLKGFATLTIDRSRPGGTQTLVLDTRDLTVHSVQAGPDAARLTATRYSLGEPDKILGAPLRILLPARAASVRIHYSTSPQASGLQWLDPAQTAGGKLPYLYSQSQAIHARSWIPLQDSPGVRISYTARIRTTRPRELLAVMSAENDPQARVTGDYRFRLAQRIPPYLIALAIGDLAFQSTGPRTGVYAEKPVVARAAKEFEDTEKMMAAAEKLYGAYRWGRYDILVLPPSFPFGGMENPRLTTATPTLLAGDKSLVAVIAHELAHSWSGNLVTNATWSDFWLNEGFTTYFERRIQEEIYGRERAEAEAYLEKAELAEEMARLAPRDQVLHIDLNGRDPDEGSTGVPYGKGILFLRMLEERFGRARFDAFLREYFDQYAFQSVTTAQFDASLRQKLLQNSASLASETRFEEWLYRPGLPANCPQPSSALLDRAARAGRPSRAWSTQEWLAFLRALPAAGAAGRLAALDREFGLTASGNAEILQRWLLLALQNGYSAADARLERFLMEVGRNRYIVPLYRELAKSAAGHRRAEAIYTKAKPGYHPITRAAVEQALSRPQR